MTKRDFPWPKKGDRLFAEEENIDENAFHLGSYMWFGLQHAGAFKAAADIVIDNSAATRRSTFRDDLLHPVAYLYRHALELKLKEIVRYGIAMHCYSRAEVRPILSDHNLAKLWTKAKQAIARRWPTVDPAPLKAVDAVINEIHQSDRDGQKWRYGTDKDGKPNRHEGLPSFVSLKSLRKTMDNVFTFLEACADGIDDGIQCMRDAM